MCVSRLIVRTPVSVDVKQHRTRIQYNFIFLRCLVAYLLPLDQTKTVSWQFLKTYGVTNRPLFAHAQWTSVQNLPEVGGNVSVGFDSRAHGCVFQAIITPSDQNFVFTGIKMGGKDHCCVINCTNGRRKARNNSEQ